LGTAILTEPFTPRSQRFVRDANVDRQPVPNVPTVNVACGVPLGLENESGAAGLFETAKVQL